MKMYLKFVVIKITVFLIGKFSNTFPNDIFEDTTKCKILIVAPHPDDEIIGLGGFIVRVLKAKKQIFILFLTDGENSGAFSDKERIKFERINITNIVLSELGLLGENILRLHLADGKVPRLGEENFNETSERITRIIEDTKADFVFATHYNDYWPNDHLGCFELTKTAIQKSKYKTEFWLYWVWTWYNLSLPRLIQSYKVSKIDISGEWFQKNKLMGMYLNPLSPDGKPWSGTLPKAMIYPFEKSFEIVEKYEI